MDIQTIKQRYGIIGNAPGLNNAISVAMRVAPTNLTVLITGESGVGKESFSNIIHYLSPRKHNPFIAVNCGAIPEGTIDSELFGHEKGSFTGAHEARKGYFETVNGGTIFLDEIGELPLGTQARLLRVLETGEYIRVGSSKVHKTDVRVVAATNVDLFGYVKNGKFREDLYYRLNTVPIFVPPLRDREEDIFLLFRKFAVDFAEKYRTSPVQLTDDAVNVLKDYSWPGNVRELKNIAEQISVLAKDKDVTAEEMKKFIPNTRMNALPMRLEEAERHTRSDFGSERDIMYKFLFDMRKDLNDLKSFVLQLAESGDHKSNIEEAGSVLNERFDGNMRALETKHSPIIINDTPEYAEDEDEVEESLSIADKEKELIKKALKKHRGRRKDAASDLGISERTLYRKIKEYHINE